MHINFAYQLDLVLLLLIVFATSLLTQPEVMTHRRKRRS